MRKRKNEIGPLEIVGVGRDYRNWFSWLKKGSRML